MKLRKIFIILITTVMISFLVLGKGLAIANAGSLTVGISKLHPDGIGYSIGEINQTATTTAEYIFNLNAYNSDNSIDSTKTLYCIKGSFGASWNSSDENGTWDSKKVTYTAYHDMEKDKEILVGSEGNTGLLNGKEGAPDYNTNSIKNNYNQILWILDNIYVPSEDSEADKIALLEAAGIKKGINETYGYECYLYEMSGKYKNIAKLGVDSGYILLNNGPIADENGEFIDVILTDSDIDAVQQAAIWYYTDSEDPHYNALINDIYENSLQTSTAPKWIHYTEDGETYFSFDTYAEKGNEGEIRNEQANILYKYLIDSAEENKNLYNNNNQLTPVEVDIEDNNTTRKIQTIETSEGGKYLFGPIKISENFKYSYNIDLELTDEDNNKIDNSNYYFANATGEKIGENKTIKDMINKGDFYLAVNKTINNNEIEELNAKITTSYKTADKKVWLEETVTEQPIVEVSKKIKEETVTLTGKVKGFDLALRKTIVSLSDGTNSKNIVNSNKESAVRTVNIDKASLENGTTATYKHRKDPVVVKTNDIVTYKITIYNEGEQAGFANKIVDQLPKGLTLMSTPGTVTSKNGTTERNTYKVSYDITNPNTYNQVVFEIEDLSQGKDLAKYDGTNLDYEEITLMCKVTADASDEHDTILTNVAYIAEAYNSEDDQIINTSNVGLDRDSAPGNNPLNKNSLSAEKLITTDIGYTGEDNKLEEKDLRDNTKYYKGQEDDDDFEKIVLLQVEKTTVSGEKIWVDENNKLQVRPEKIKIGLYKVNEQETEVLVKQIEVTSKSNWKYTFTKLDKYDIDGNLIEYKVKELDENNKPRENGQIFSSGKGGKYKVSYNEKSNDITNTYIPFDLALFKYIAAISEDAVIQEGEYVTDNKNSNGTYLRAPIVTNINSDGTITYKEHDKSPLIVENGNYVLYRIRVYNEGKIDGYASLIKDSLPEGLEFVIGTENELTEDEKNYVTNVNGIWEYETSEDLSIIVTDYLAKGNGAEFGAMETDKNYKANLLKALNVNGEISNENPDWLEVEILCKVTAPNSLKSILVNRAEIAEDTDENGDSITDIDSTPNKWEESPRDDDQDIEKIRLQCFDLSLRKYIFSVNGVELENGASRVPVVDVSKLYKKDEKGNVLATTATYKHPKTSVAVCLGDTIVYSLRVYNEGDVDGFASEITDHLPEYLEFIENSKINEKYGWEVSTDGRTVTTRYLSADQYELKGFTENSTTLDYEEIQIECKIKETAKSHENITNIAEITEYKYEDNIVEKDADSEADSLTDEDKKDFLPEDKDLPTYKENEKGEYIPGQEDDDDFEKVYVKEFDLALRKFITAISKDEDIQNSEYLLNGNNYSREPKVDVSKLNKKDEKTGKVRTTATYTHTKEPVKVSNGEYVEYTIRVYNEGEVAGYATTIEDYIFENEGLEYVPESNVNKKYEWVMLDKDGKVTEDVTKVVKVATNYLSKENETTAGENLIQEYKEGSSLKYKDIKIVFKVIEENSSNKILANIAEVVDDSNEKSEEVIDRDSEPGSDEKNYPNGDNKYATEEHEDDIDYDVVILKEFDLALRKFITGIASNAKVSNVEDNNDGEITILDLELLEDEIYADYTPLGIIEIPKTNIKYPILKEYTKSSIEIAVGKLYGVDPNEVGNMALSSHNYRNDKLFSNNKNLSVGDNIYITDLTGNKIKYVIYKKYETAPDDTEYLKRDTNGSREISLATATDDSSARLIILAKEAEKVETTDINYKEVTSRIPQVSYEDGKIAYTHPKDALEVVVGSVVEYTIRVYNEGEVAGYASEITDDIPDYLEYLPENSTNKKYGWVMYDKDGEITDEVEEAVKIKTTYLSKEAGEERVDKDSKENPNLLNSFEKSKEISKTNPEYKDVKVTFKVKDPGSSEYIITNHAQISEDQDENGNDVTDKDSIPDEWNDGEDDQDIENIKVQYFDLALLKYVSKVIITEDGKETITETGYNGYETPEPVVKVELDRKKLSKITVKYVYSIQITNEGEIAGYATEITDYVPEGLKFYAEDNENWTDEGNNVISTKALKNTLLQPGESATVQVTLRWINDKENLGLKINTAEISEDYNEKGAPDKDSTPDNKIEGEDDIDTAEVILAVKTGKGATYIMLVLAVLTILGGGIALIKKFVL